MVYGGLQPCAESGAGEGCAAVQDAVIVYQVALAGFEADAQGECGGLSQSGEEVLGLRGAGTRSSGEVVSVAVDVQAALDGEHWLPEVSGAVGQP